MKTLKLRIGIQRYLPVIAVSMGLGMSTAFAAPQKTVNINLSGKSFGIVLDPITNMQRSKNLRATSKSKTIILSTKYKYNLTGSIHGTGDLEGFVTPGMDIKDFFEDLKLGSGTILSRTITTTDGTLIGKNVIKGTKNLGFFTVEVSLTVQGSISPTGVVSASLTNLKVVAPVAVSGTIVFDGPTATKPGAKFSVTSL